MKIIRSAQCFRDPLGDLRSKWCPTVTFNGLGRPNLRMISWSSIFFFFLNYILSLLSRDGEVFWVVIFIADLKWRRQWYPIPVLLPGKSHELRSLVGCSPWDREESGTTERLHFHFSLSCIGEGNGNPLQCSCLENPRDEGAWWAAISGVAQSWTWLKWLSSSSSWFKELVNSFYVSWKLRPPGTMEIISNAQCFRDPLGDLKSKWCPIVTL